MPYLMGNNVKKISKKIGICWGTSHLEALCPLSFQIELEFRSLGSCGGRKPAKTKPSEQA